MLVGLFLYSDRGVGRELSLRSFFCEVEIIKEKIEIETWMFRGDVYFIFCFRVVGKVKSYKWYCLVLDGNQTLSLYFL